MASCSRAAWAKRSTIRRPVWAVMVRIMVSSKDRRPPSGFRPAKRRDATADGIVSLAVRKQIRLIVKNLPDHLGHP